jgi:membrane protein
MKVTFHFLKKFSQLKNIGGNTFFILKQTINESIDDNVLKLSAALSYYTIFSLPPLLIVIISITGVFFGADAVRGELFGQINGLVGNAAAMQIQEAIKNVSLSKSNVFVTTLGLIILLIGASGVFSEIQESLNFIWGIVAKPKRGVVKFIKNRLMSFSMIGSLGFLLLVGLVINSITDMLNNRLAARFPLDAFYLFHTINIIIMFGITTLLFALIFRTLPDGKIVLRDCIIGASFTAFLFMIGKFAIGAYLGSSLIASVYGAAGSVILILVWVYYSAIILYFGAEFTKVYAITHGDKIVPNEYSVILLKQQIEIEPDAKLAN